MININFNIDKKTMSGCCLTSSEQCFSYIMARKGRFNKEIM